MKSGQIIRGEALNDSCFRSFKISQKVALILIFYMSGSLKINAICPWIHFPFGPLHSCQEDKTVFKPVLFLSTKTCNYAQTPYKPFHQRRGPGLSSKTKFKRGLLLCSSAQTCRFPDRHHRQLKPDAVYEQASFRRNRL